MPDLELSLQGQDLGHLKIIAMLWGIDFHTPDAKVGLPHLVRFLLDVELMTEVIDGLPEKAKQALIDLVRHEGKIPWALFVRRYGTVREMGAARRDRERPFLDSNTNITEALWYRGFLARTFFDTPQGPEEFAYIPDDLLSLMANESSMEDIQSLGRPATSAEKIHTIPATDWLLDDSCTLLAGLRLNLPLDTLDEYLICARVSSAPLNAFNLKSLLASAGLINEDGKPNPNFAQKLLKTGRGEALVALVHAWLQSPAFNELRMLSGIKSEGEWKNDPLMARRAVLDFLSRVPGWSPGGKEAVYWSLGSFVTSIHQKFPDFQRPAGDYDSWYLIDANSGEYLRGVDHWDEVDGEIIRFMIAGPLHWLGIVDLGFDAVPTVADRLIPTSFRISHWAPNLLSLTPPSGITIEDEKLIVESNGMIKAKRLVPRTIRYQIARFSDWGEVSSGVYRYQLTPESLQKAQEQGLNVNQLIQLLMREAITVPPKLVNALSRWEEHGSEARIESITILRVKNPEILAKLRQSKASRFLGEQLGPTAVAIHSGAGKKVAAVLAEWGYLSEIKLER
jgi:Helicase conserved C-terminal domain